MGVQPRLGDVAGIGKRRALMRDGVRDGECHRVGDARQAQGRSLDMGGIDVQARDIDHLGLAPGKDQVAAGVDHAQIAGLHRRACGMDGDGAGCVPPGLQSDMRQGQAHILGPVGVLGDAQASRLGTAVLLEQVARRPADRVEPRLRQHRPRRHHRVQPLREQLQQSLRGSLADHERLMRALHPLAQPPAGDGWNRSELIDLLPPGPPVEAAVLAGIVPRANGAQVILTRRTETLRTHGGQVGFPGGRTEPDDRDALAAALRESQEEIALAPGQVQALGYLDPFVTITGYRVTPVVAVVDPDFVPVPQPSEVAEVFEVPLDYLMAPDSLRQVEITHRGRVRHVLEYGWPGQRIWGATAAILYNLRRRLEQVQ